MAWDGAVTIGDRKINLQIGGESEPDARLLRHAREIVSAFEEFEAKVTSCLEAGKPQFKAHEQEIEHLQIESIALYWPERPEDGMIYFQGPDKYRLWRCDIIQRTPTGLGFDD